MFEGALSFWHIIIVAGVVFLVFGPRRIADTFHRLGNNVRSFADGESVSAIQQQRKREARPRGLAYRLGRLLRRRKQR